MSSEGKEIAMLTILLATCETTLDTLRAADNPIDRALVADLERLVERTRHELEAVAQTARAESG